MGRPRKQKAVPETLGIAEKKYIDLLLRSSNNVNYDELFKRVSIELDKSEKLIRDYANKLDIPIVDQQLPPEPKPKVLQPEQEMVRNLMTPNRLKEPNKARHITVMSEVSAEIIEKQLAQPIKGSQKMKNCVFRQ